MATPVYDPFDATVRKDPLPIYQRLREESPCHYLEAYDAWALSRFQDIWDASNDPDSYSAARGTTPAQCLTRDQPVTPMLNVMDPPAHTKLRSVIRGCFMPRHLRALEPEIRRWFEGYVDEAMEGEGCDVVQDLGARLSVRVACAAIGLPAEDGPMLVEWVQRFFHHDPGHEGVTPAGLNALQELTAYCCEQAARCHAYGAEGPQALPSLCRFEHDGKTFDLEEIGSHATMLVIGGSETFPKTLANGILRLWQHPDQRAALVRGPAGIPAAYDEILRYDMPTQFLCRTLRRDVGLHGQTMKRGQAVMFLYASANRDPREFERPDEFDIARRAPRMLSFGAGTHACLGTHVARLEGRITLETLLARAPNYEVDLSRAERFETEFVQGFSRLPIHFAS